jgi:hypothetical protein
MLSTLELDPQQQVESKKIMVKRIETPLRINPVILKVPIHPSGMVTESLFSTISLSSLYSSFTLAVQPEDIGMS